MKYTEDLNFAKALAREAGEVIHRYFKAEDIGTEWKEDNTPLTVADSSINKLVIQKVKEKFPEHGVIGEEESFETNRNFVWVVDPIDGTIPYSIGVPISTFSIALVDRKDGQPVIAVVHDPYLDHLYEATKGGGAYLNGKKLQTSNTNNLEQNFVFAYGLKSGKDKVYEASKLFDIIQEQGAKVISVASFIYFGCKVASGELVGIVIDFPSAWDLVTVNLIIKEAGGVVTNYSGNSQRYDQPTKGMIAGSNENIHAILTKAVQEAKP